MVSFTCNVCQDVVKKPKVVGHAGSCGSHSFTCVDCMQVFDLTTIKPHTTCVSEVQKYQGKWVQKNTASLGGPKKNLDSSDEEGTAKPKTDGLMRPARATMDDLDTDSDDDDWMGSGSKKSRAPAPSSRTAGKKHPRPGAASSSDDDEDAHTHASPAKKAAVVEKPHVKAATSPKPNVKKSPKVATPTPSATVATRKGHTPLLLPRTTAATECEMAGFVLDTTDSLASIVKDVLANEGGGASSMKKKDLAKALVERYLVRIAKKGMMPAVDAAVQMGGLAEDAHGNVRLA